jgi:hypothetical protein
MARVVQKYIRNLNHIEAIPIDSRVIVSMFV